eukprot:756482-Hanusia_phi.AAC.4
MAPSKIDKTVQNGSRKADLLSRACRIIVRTKVFMACWHNEMAVQLLSWTAKLQRAFFEMQGGEATCRLDIESVLQNYKGDVRNFLGIFAFIKEIHISGFVLSHFAVGQALWLSKDLKQTLFTKTDAVVLRTQYTVL